MNIGPCCEGKAKKASRLPKESRQGNRKAQGGRIECGKYHQAPCSATLGLLPTLSQLIQGPDLSRQPAAHVPKGHSQLGPLKQSGREIGALLPILASPLSSATAYSCSAELQAPHSRLTGRAIRNNHPPLKPLALSTA